MHALPETQQWLLVLSLFKLTVDSLLFFPLVINNYTCMWKFIPATGYIFALQTHFAGVNFNPTKEQGSHGKRNMIFKLIQ